jgi:hypothetical protein
MSSMTVLYPKIMSHADSAVSPRRRPSIQAVQCDVLEAIVSSQHLNQVADLLRRRIEMVAPSTVCSILAVDVEGRLRQLAAANLPTAYGQAIDSVEFRPNLGSCGSAAYRGVTVGRLDISADPKLEHIKEMHVFAWMDRRLGDPIEASVNPEALRCHTPKACEQVRNAVAKSASATSAISVSLRASQPTGQTLHPSDRATVTLPVNPTGLRRRSAHA